MNIDDELRAQLRETAARIEAEMDPRDARVAELEAENAAARELLDKARNETETRQTTQAEARLAAVIALCDASDQGYDWSCFVSDVRAAAAGDTT